MADLGQIHIDANIKILATANNEKLADFTLAKTFAGGVAASLTGQEQTKAAVVAATGRR